MRCITKQYMIEWLEILMKSTNQMLNINVRKGINVFNMARIFRVILYKHTKPAIQHELIICKPIKMQTPYARIYIKGEIFFQKENYYLFFNYRPICATQFCTIMLPNVSFSKYYMLFGR